MKLFTLNKPEHDTLTNNYVSDEYVSLRNELTTRINIMNGQAQTAMVTIFAIWGAGFLLYAKIPELIEKYKTICPLILICLSNFIFLVPAFYFIPLAIKSGENIAQIASLSAYIKIFYECKSLEKPLYHWESTNNAASRVNVDRKKKAVICTISTENTPFLQHCL